MRSSRVGVTTAWGAAAFTAAACGLVTDLDGLSGDGDERDAGADAVEASAGPDDAGPTPDVAVDPEKDAGADATACTSQFCEDFDDDAGFSRWGVQRTAGSSSSLPSLGVDGRSKSNGTASFFAEANPAGYAGRASLTKPFVVDPGKSLVCSLDVLIEEIGSGASPVFALLASDPEKGGVDVGLTVYFDGSSDVMQTYADGRPARKAAGPTTAVGWRHLQFTFERSTTPLFRVTDGAITWPLALEGWPDVSSVSFIVGIVYAAPSDENSRIALRIDHVRCDVQ